MPKGKKTKKKNKYLSFQDIIMSLQKFWGKFGCVILQPYDIEVGAGPVILISEYVLLVFKNLTSKSPPKHFILTLLLLVFPI